jgi:hypothetical protein
MDKRTNQSSLSPSIVLDCLPQQRTEDDDEHENDQEILASSHYRPRGRPRPRFRIEAVYDEMRKGI